MADNFDTNAGSGGSRFRSDDLGGAPAVHVPAIKVYTGADGVDGGFASDTNRIPVGASAESSSMTVAGVNVTPKFATIAASASGNNTIVAAVTSKKIRVLAAQLTANGSVNAKWQSGAGGTDLTGLAYLVVNTGYVLPYNPAGWFETASNTLLNLNLSAAIAVGGSITYIEV
jgi:hypothetical protein